MKIARPHLSPPFGGNGYPTSASENFRPAMPAPHLLPKRVFVGAIISSRSATDLSIIERGILGVGSGGVIRFLDDLDVLEKQAPHPTASAASTRSNSTESSTSASTSTAGTSSTIDDRSSTPVAIRGSTRSTLPDAPELTSLEMPPPAVPSPTPAQPSLDERAQREQQLIKHVLDKHGWRHGQYKLTRLPPGSFLCSGFIDTHTHACQVPNIGLGQQYELLDWLQHVTFPRERRFEDSRYARKTYESVVQRLIDSGTTTACYYATLHLDASKILAEICNERGQRAFVGKCQMDRNSPIDYIEKNASQSIEDTKEFVRFTRSLRPYGQPPDVSSPSMSPADLHHTSPEMDASIARLSATMDELMSPTSSKPPSEADGSPSSAKILPPSARSLVPSSARTSVPVVRQASSSSVRSARESGTSTPSRQRERELNNALVQPILTPRFAISCTDAMLTGISALLSRDPTLRVQTHLSENEGEITFTKQLFPFAKNYTSVYDHYSLLGPRTILAHAVHLDADELAIIKKRKCGVSHCPTSNLNLRSGASRVGEMLNMGIKVGLGTDVSGGFGLGMLSAIREASVVAKVLAFQRAQAESKEEQDALQATAPPTSEQSQAQAQQPLAGAAAVDGRYPGPPVAGQYQPRKPHSIATSTLNHTQVTQSVQDPASSLTSKKTIDFTKGPLSIATLFYLATLGGAEVCAMASRIGSLEVGKEFDALLVQTTSHWGPAGYTGNPGCFVEEDDTLPDVFEKWMFTGDDRNIGTVFVRGRVVGGAKPLRD
ncbi:related to guanine deaminase [Ustilago bromivora]|uniref:Related to guanine deaminase n=2 Tax=Ustilago bromivora TaxID=307758 RepID=A0A1K0G4L1_9BASI|nr:related to guanine deaminase [Ustilago bromivora]